MEKDGFGAEYLSQIVPQIRLSPQQARIMELLEEGRLVKEIGDRLGISVNTTKKHLQKIYRKAGAGTAREAIHLCRFHSTRLGQ